VRLEVLVEVALVDIGVATLAMSAAVTPVADRRVFELAVLLGFGIHLLVECKKA